MTTPDSPRPPFRSRREIHQRRRAEEAKSQAKASDPMPTEPANPEPTTSAGARVDSRRRQRQHPRLPEAAALQEQVRRRREVAQPQERTHPRPDVAHPQAPRQPETAKPEAQTASHSAETLATRQPAPRRTGPLLPETPNELASETTGMRSRRLALERRNVVKRRRKRRIRSFFIIVFVLVLLGGAAWFAYEQLADHSQSSSLADDYVGEGTGSVEVTIEEGESGTAIGKSLVEADVVKSMDAFARAFNANKAATSIRPGTYTLKQRMSASAAIAALLDDANRADNTVTVTSGQTVAQVKEKIVSVTGLSAAEVDKAFADPDAIGLPSVAGGNAEGWLFPGSYEVSSSDTPTTLVAKMVKGRVDELAKLKVPEDQQQTVLNKASILEREVNIDNYLRMVARVIENRLADPQAETRGLLQMDSSVLYGVGKTGGIPSAEDLANDNPYNTYLHQGLPPGPIAQPSTEAIQAVLEPADGSWLYYVTINLDTGETLFATTLEEQNQNIEKFKAYCSANPGKC